MMTGNSPVDSLLIAAAALAIGLLVLPRLRPSAASPNRGARPQGTRVQRVPATAGRLHLVDIEGKLALFGEPASGRVLLLLEGEDGQLLFRHRSLTSLREAELLERSVPREKEGALGRLLDRWRAGGSGMGQVGVGLVFDAEADLPAESLTLWLPAAERQHARAAIEALCKGRGPGGARPPERRSAKTCRMVPLGGSARTGS